ncbi:monooxygenase [Actinoplanes lobatus]|uniref:Monooxygenase n=1 Tax=Actinoplanes lobatus TaxID=113568 RepID=A0A7W7HKC3_9ACTN|nr:LLM class flavin-dependent oxidoreductase [Actinoplanes lobatus]MBB4752080.1 alkanesulfonate monooxygenase SsuD/methylene tetrahydromethanopterin reductase-like flavin-dependent oxidoreductase (luciferase family) [Actinoplanes lobatus]GGN98857.1 monooxygenase [Actinoplanes lobatus]GIE46225.1 monooxygenase [Actinoplanes lobatus]
MTARTLAFLTPGNYPDNDPYAGLEDTLQLFEYGERLGFDGAWIRQRHLEHGVGSAAVFLAAASQRTSRVELGTAVIPIGYESPFRLAEDLSMADVLSRGRLQAGFSAGTPPHAELIGHLVFDGDWRTFDLSHGRIARLIDNLRGEFLGDADTVIQSPGNTQRPRLQPHNPGLINRLWYGAASTKSARWAAENGLNLLTGNIGFGEHHDDFTSAQLALIGEYRRLVPPARAARVAVGRVIVPTDSADRATRERYRQYAAGRHARTLAPQGERRVLFAPDLVGPADEIAERLATDPVLAETSELRLELPYEFQRGDYEQILHDTVHLIAPALGWQRDAVASGVER